MNESQEGGRLAAGDTGHGGGGNKWDHSEKLGATLASCRHPLPLPELPGSSGGSVTQTTNLTLGGIRDSHPGFRAERGVQSLGGHWASLHWAVTCFLSKLIRDPLFLKGTELFHVPFSICPQY